MHPSWRGIGCVKPTATASPASQEPFKQLVQAFLKRVCGAVGVVRVKGIRRSGTMSLLLRASEADLEDAPDAVVRIRNAVYLLMQRHGPFREQCHDILIRPYAGPPAGPPPAMPCTEVLFVLDEVLNAEAFMQV